MRQSPAPPARLEQATLEYMAWSSVLSDLTVEVQPRGKGVVNTVGAFGRKYTTRRELPNFRDTHMDSAGFVLNDDGSRSAVVHQYDRLFGPFPDLLFGALYFSQMSDANGTRQMCTFRGKTDAGHSSSGICG